MKDLTKYCGVIPAFYACYDAEGNISTEGAKALTRHLIAKGVKGVYVGGSSGECIYQHPDERKKLLEAVMSEAKGKITVIADYQHTGLCLLAERGRQEQGSPYHLLQAG